jgi:hypothetical protein
MSNRMVVSNPKFIEILLTIATFKNGKVATILNGEEYEITVNPIQLAAGENGQ